MEQLNAEKISQKTGMPSGSTVYVGKKKSGKVDVSAIVYDKTSAVELNNASVEKCLKLRDTNKLIWIDVDGLHQPEIVEKICKAFDIHSLVIEDILNTQQRPKTEEFVDYVFVTMKFLNYQSKNNSLEVEHAAFVLGKNFVLSFTEQKNNDFDPIRKRLHAEGEKIRLKSPDYLFHALIDIAVDKFFNILEEIGNYMELLEDEIMEKPNKIQLQKIQENKKELMHLRHSVYPLREIISKLHVSDSEFIAQENIKYFRDVYDHTVQIIETTESFRDMNASLKDLYMSGISLQMNQTMQILTAISLIFIPLTFLAGVYGMNFDVLPEIHWKYGYFTLWAVMITIALSMFRYFKRKKWF
jgi:magnesium transporter